jgi:hypothetical protein
MFACKQLSCALLFLVLSLAALRGDEHYVGQINGRPMVRK